MRGINCPSSAMQREEKKISDIDDRWSDVPALQALPSHVFNELKSFQEEADLLSKQKPVRQSSTCKSVYFTFQQLVVTLPGKLLCDPLT